MTNYILGNTNESDRLNYQSEQRNYRPSNELPTDELTLLDGSTVLDAGCGTGLYSRYIAEINSKRAIQIHAVDSSEQRILEAQSSDENISYQNVKFSVQDLRNLDLPSESIDMVVCRFVYQHIKDYCQEVSDELFRVLKPGGRLYVIDSDGILYNMDSEDERLNEYLNVIQNSDFNFEGYVCRKIPRYLQRAGFLHKNISISPKPMLFFESDDRNYERKLWEMRFNQIKDVMTPVLGEKPYADFTSRFISELMNPHCFLYYSKFVFKAIKHERSSH